jgi:hypothetical protein
VSHIENLSTEFITSTFISTSPIKNLSTEYHNLNQSATKMLSATARSHFRRDVRGPQSPIPILQSPIRKAHLQAAICLHGVTPLHPVLLQSAPDPAPAPAPAPPPAAARAPAAAYNSYAYNFDPYYDVDQDGPHCDVDDLCGHDDLDGHDDLTTY